MVHLLTVVSVWVLFDSIFANVNRVGGILSAISSIHTDEQNRQIRDKMTKRRSASDIDLTDAITEDDIRTNEDVTERVSAPDDVSTTNTVHYNEKTTYPTTDHISTGTTNTNMYVSPTLTAEKPTVTVPHPVLHKGEAPPSRSAQLGMGFGITFIGILLISEIIYFKRCYRRDQRHGEYRA